MNYLIMGKLIECDLGGDTAKLTAIILAYHADKTGFVDGFSVNQISDQLGRSTRTVQRAMKALREIEVIGYATPDRSDQFRFNHGVLDRLMRGPTPDSFDNWLDLFFNHHIHERFRKYHSEIEFHRARGIVRRKTGQEMRYRDYKAEMLIAMREQAASYLLNSYAEYEQTSRENQWPHILTEVAYKKRLAKEIEPRLLTMAASLLDPQEERLQ